MLLNNIAYHTHIFTVSIFGTCISTQEYGNYTTLQLLRCMHAVMKND